MPYNTRRKSLSLPSLGIHVPVTHAARAAAHRATSGSQTSSPAAPSTPSSSSSAASAAATPASAMSPPSREDSHPNKKVKRSHSSGSDRPASHAMSPRQRDAAVKLENTPPPSPRDSRGSVEMEDAADGDVDAGEAPMRVVDLEGVNDEIVEAVIVQLQATRNRPHLVKELANILMQQLRVVQQSANPCAIISSRLSTYLKRSCWSAIAPCPLAKELETVHPRRTYFYLTTVPHQPIPDPTAAHLIRRTIISPSISSATSGSEDADPDRRRELSPSPEIDLSSPEFDDGDDDIAMPTTPIGSLSMRLPQLLVASSRHHQQRSASPPLEKDEKEFTQTADGLQKRKLTGDGLAPAAAAASDTSEVRIDVYDVARDDNLFGDKVNVAGGAPATMAFVSSPAIRPSFALNLKKDDEAESWSKLDNMLEWDRSPENIELDELDGLLTDF